jgi:hypothetical protein
LYPNVSIGASDLGVLRSSVLTFCDLAGSERFDLTSAVKKSAADRQETQNINKSIYALGNCIQALSRGTVKNKHGCSGSYIPYRDSKLTRLLADSISKSHTRMCVVCTISPMLYGYAESVCSLTFASRYLLLPFSVDTIMQLFISK